ncbi:uncharacterized protein LOC133291976 [Gastrolobium bilobum]|uniref:uncharacterized protein LOC133291976 n=1 Tax=Gastrolobium bilobum TaxID=150636 RepID=UPI002AB1C48F|nr:uncharacterized protein LOC133291976 [Gastrolobium bilobum]
MEFNEGEHVFVRLSPITGIGRALGVRKLSPRFIGSYQILGRVRPIAYQLGLPPNIANIHDVFNVSQLQRYIADPLYIMQPDDVEIRENLKTPIGSLKILDRGEKKLRSKIISMVEVQWEGRTPE